MGRIIDSDAINKRVFADIANTFQHSQKITGEKTVQDFSGTDDPRAAAADNFNFNGIEMSKIKQLINYIQTHKKEFKFDRQLLKLSNTPLSETQLDYSPEKINASGERYFMRGLSKNVYSALKQVEVPDKFDGRNSFVFPRIRCSIYLPIGVEYGAYDGYDGFERVVCEVSKTKFLEREFSQYESLVIGLSKQMDVNGWQCFGSPMKGSSKSSLVVDKTKNIISFRVDINLSTYNIGWDSTSDWLGGTENYKSFSSAAVEKQTCINNVYLDILCVYWRDK